MMTPRLPIVISALLAFAGAAAAQERQWTLDASDQDAYLIFGVPDSDDVGISLWCPIRQGLVNIFVPEANGTVPAGEEVKVTLKADDTTAELVGRTESNEDAGTSSVEAQIPADSPFFKTMLQVDRFHVKVADEDNIFPLVEADVAGLLDLCRK